MVLIVGGAPVSGKKAYSCSPRWHGPHGRQLPQIPQNGAAAHIGSEILVSRVEEIGFLEEQQRNRSLRSTSNFFPDSTTASPLRQRPPSSKTGEGNSEKGSFVHQLLPNDQIHAPRFLDTLLCSHNDFASYPSAKGALGLEASHDMLPDRAEAMPLEIDSQSSHCPEDHSPRHWGSLFSKTGLLDDTGVLRRPNDSRGLNMRPLLSRDSSIRPSTSNTQSSARGQSRDSSSNQIGTPRTRPSRTLLQRHGQDSTASLAQSSMSSSPSKATTARSQSKQPNTFGTPSRQSTHGETRQRHLRYSFKHGLRDIALRLMDLEQTTHQFAFEPRRTDGFDDNDTAHRAQQNLLLARSGYGIPISAPRQSGMPSEPAQAPELSEDLKTALQDVFKAFESSAISCIPQKRCLNQEKEQVHTQASGEELNHASAVLNFHRWLCGLPSVNLNKACMRTCEILNQAVLPRSPLLMKTSSPHFSLITNFAAVLGELAGTRGNCLLLQGEASLLDGIEQCLMASHARSESKLRTSLRGLKGAVHDSTIATIRSRAEKHKKRLPAEVAQKVEFNVVIPPLSGVSVITLHDLPPSLQALRVLWELGGKVYATVLPEPSAQLPRKKEECAQPSQPPGKLKKHTKSTIREVAWGLEKDGKPAARNEARQRKMLFRRYLLSPDLRSFGASRVDDICAVWTGAGEVTLPGEVSEAKPSRKMISRRSTLPATAETEAPELNDVVCYPAPGFFPYELLRGCVPTWTIMPSCQRYQPTQSLNIQMWRIRIQGGHAERLDEVVVPSFVCDCSPNGNPFCIIFKPELQSILEGEQFEVEIDGLRGPKTKLHFFHDFRYIHIDHLDFHLMTAAQDFCTMLEQTLLWKPPTNMAEGLCASVPETVTQSIGRVRGSQSERDSVLKYPSKSHSKRFSRLMLPDIYLVSHTSLRFTSDAADITMSISCPGARVLLAKLLLVRASGEYDIERSTWVLKCETNWVIRVKLPMGAHKYKLVFRVAMPAAPDTLYDHETMYHITATEACQTLLPSLETPLRQKFGFAHQSLFAQFSGITVVAPLMYRARVGYVYFLVHVGAEAYSHLDCSNTDHLDATLFSHRLAPDAGDDRRREQGFGQQHGVQSLDCVAVLHQNLRPALEPLAQDVKHSLHIDVSVMEPCAEHGTTAAQRYVKRLHRRPDLPEFFDRLLWFGENDSDCTIEMHLRSPRGQVQGYAPVRIGEWKLTQRAEEFPRFF